MRAVRGHGQSRLVPIDTSCAVLLALVEAMCESLPATSSDTDEEQLHQNIFNVFLDMVTSFQLGDRLEAYLTEEELVSWTVLPLRPRLPLRQLEHALSRNSFFSPFYSAGQQVFFPPEMTLCARGHLTSSLGLVRVALLARGRAHGIRPWGLRAQEILTHRTCGDRFSLRLSHQVKMRERSWKRHWNPPCRASRATTFSTGRPVALSAPTGKHDTHASLKPTNPPESALKRLGNGVL